jgi:glycosyltransferase involved in cell wall biosynthesis
MSSIHTLVITTLYPNSQQIRHGVFVENRIRHLKHSGQVVLKVIAPVPWFPCKSKYFPSYSRLVAVPKHEVRDGIDVYHPRYLVIPKIGMLLTPFMLAYSIYRQVKALQAEGYRFDLIDAHYYYPDGVAAAIVAKMLKKPLSITARGTDINLISNFSVPRKMIVWASKVATLNLAVCEALRQRMLEIGIAPASTHVLRNGVDLQLFKPLPRDELREKLQIDGKLLISVGYLIERKGHHLIIEAMPTLPNYRLWIVGGGEWEQKLKALALQLGVADRVQFIGEVSPQQLPELYNVADALVLASDREGWANVLLEAMACGTPVVASKIWGTPEVVQAPEAGVLCEARTPSGIAAAINQLFANYPQRHKTRQYAEKFSWDETVSKMLTLFAGVKNGVSSGEKSVNR